MPLLFHDHRQTLVRYSTVCTLPLLDNDELQAECQAFQRYNRLIHTALALPIMRFCDCYRNADKRSKPVCCAHPVCSVSSPPPLRSSPLCMCRNVCGIIMLCAEVSLHNRVGWAVGRGGVQTVHMCGASVEIRLITGGEYSGGC